MNWNKEKGTIYEALTVSVILLFFLCVFVLGIALPLRKSYSDEEKRELKHFPAFSVYAVLNGQYFKDISSWYQDSYPGKEKWLSLSGKVQNLYGFQGDVLYGEGKNVAESIPETGEMAETFAIENIEETSPVSNEGKNTEREVETASDSESSDNGSSSENKKEQNFETDAEGNLEIQKADADVALQGETVGSLYLSGKEAFELYYFSEKGVRSYASLLNTVESLYPNLEISTLIAPNSFGILLDPQIQEKLASSGMDQAISYTYSLMNPKIHSIDVFSSLMRHKTEYIYFRTDHHWTQLGAYYAYAEFCKDRGLVAKSLESFTKAEYKDFYGTFYFYMNRPEAMKGNPDTVIAYTGEVNDMRFLDASGKEYSGNLINDAENMLPGNKYNCFMLGDHPYAEIHNENGEKNLIVIKDSYGNAIIPFLAQNYKNIYVIDYRYYDKKLPELIEEKEINEILFVNNVMGVGESLSAKMMSLFR